MEIDEISLSKGMFLSIKETDTLREAYKRLREENKRLHKDNLFVLNANADINLELSNLKERVKELEEKNNYSQKDMKQFIEFLLAEGIVIQEESKSSNLDFLHNVWSGKNPDGLLE